MSNLIRRDELVKMISEWKSGLFGSTQNQHTGKQKVMLHNQGQNMLAGLPITVTGRMFPNVSQNDAITEYLNYGVQLAGSAPDNDPDPVIAVTADPIYGNRIGKVWLDGVFGASVNIKNQTHKYADCDSSGLFSSNAGPFRIVAKCGSFAFLMPSQHSGHLAGTTNSTLTGPNATVMVTVEDEKYECDCPLLASDGKISSGKKVFISRNLVTGKWQIIAAECEK